ncbi:MAG TPA: SRPBCC family protein [Caulobacter sp.]|nr:SRPBCC family protein [Caulobacter sp.]
MSDRIEKSIDLKASVARVWRALTDSAEFGAWFRVDLDGPFVAGEEVRGRVTHPGYEHLVWKATVVRMDEPTLFAFTWHPYAVDADVDYDSEPPTLVEFRLEALADGVRLTICESGFDALPAERRDEAFLRNSGGWTAQVENIRAHVER